MEGMIWWTTTSFFFFLFFFFFLVVTTFLFFPFPSPLGLQPASRPPTPTSVPTYCSSQSSNCTILSNRDFDQGTMWISKGASSVSECCDLCTAAASIGCVCAAYSGTTCYFKNATQCSIPEYNQGVTSVWPAGSGPVPPLPPPGEKCDMSLLPFKETHGYYQHGEGFKTVNSPSGNLQPFAANVPPALPPFSKGGNGCPGTYASEFGAVAISSFESMAPTLDPTNWGLHAPPMSQRNYAVDNFVTAYTNIAWPQAFDNVTGAAPFKKQLYWAMLAQAIWVKSDIEARRAQNTWGTITWQFNEIWPTGGWGSIGMINCIYYFGYMNDSFFFLLPTFSFLL
jgi:beta-mannosidase